MYRDDRDALANEVEGLREELQQARGQNQAMKQALLAQRHGVPALGKAIYRSGASMQLAEGEKIALSEHRLEGSSVWLIAILHLLTFGLSSMIHFSLKHDRLPEVAEDDPSGGRAVGFMFIPYFNFYWVFQNALRLADRINFQFELRGEAPMVNRSLILVSCILGVIPYVNILVGPFVWLAAAINYQQAINRLAALGPGYRGQRALPGQGGWGPTPALGAPQQQGWQPQPAGQAGAWQPTQPGWQAQAREGYPPPAPGGATSGNSTATHPSPPAGGGWGQAPSGHAPDGSNQNG